jgi:hypothetical protein
MSVAKREESGPIRAYISADLRPRAYPANVEAFR